MTERPVEGIAVVGIGCRFPGADGPAAFWRLLRDGVDAVTEVPAERWDADALYDPDLGTPGTASTRWGGFVSGLWEMDAPFFDVSPREAAAMDPQQRLLLAVAWEALEHAAIPPEQLAGGDGGVFLGVGPNEYAATGFGDLARVNAYFAAGNATCMAVNRVSGFLDLRGPGLAVDSGCSSSLLAVHLACQALRAGECSTALAGGVSAVLSPQAAVGLSQAWMSAADGRCKSFDAAADGYVRSEGCGVVVLKRLADALRDDDRVLAVLLGSATNQDGRGAGLTVPSPAAQAAVVRRALERSGVEPDGVDYVEAHGVGTPASDLAEAEALTAVFGGPRVGEPCTVGSVKTNVGHLEPAAGIAGLVKTVLALEHGEIPPHLHFRELPEEIRAAGFPFRIPLERTPWPRSGRPRRAGINSFGLGGTNVHLVVEEPPALPAPVAVYTGVGERRLLLLSARTEPALRALAGRWAERLEGAGAAELRDLCHT
ncbi:MAG TPA: beta-ketoacyl synthase N-terminal-like domain-containing protein, partial [Longimicrobiaceae bacterium]|nr:beta-ketoacyl synthase N-terminal-like domain-containing protein [Longimicrobiaceae bacterium]